MRTCTSRRDFLQAALGTGATVSLAALGTHPAAARAAGSSPITTQRLGEHLVLLSGAGANVVAAAGPDSLLMVDGGLKERAGDLLKAVHDALGQHPVRTLFNTHWHPEQTGSNERLGSEGVKIIAHENTRLWLGYEQEVPLQHRTYGPLPPKARPNETLHSTYAPDATAKLTFGGEQIEYGYLMQAHTDGDIYVFFRQSNVLVAGGPVSAEGWPVIDWRHGGWIGGQVEALQTLWRLADDQTRVIPANGPVLTKADLKAQHDMYAAILDRLGKLLRKGMGPDEALAAAPTKEFDAKWGEPTPFVTMAFKSLWGHMAPDA
jgi:glyoxylase-like metal-dependent hydrolase (beta-lactamase superfamily II)